MNEIKYKDFLPQAKPRGGLFGGVDYSGFDDCVAAMNHWLARNPVDVIRLETVTLPNIHSIQEEGPADTELHASGHTVWYQFLRLWYWEAADQ
jgi:hypothetical protein